ncbi:glycosyltransferase family 2 protein [Emcibacter sp. SYSU 3D8]|uniref:glycosyltransferase family 2 protein n=1 Tax=Emcibacter sp. SYSU 3D8 TaxID=3133969 RepID=UPI0031FF15CC
MRRVRARVERLCPSSADVLRVFYRRWQARQHARDLLPIKARPTSPHQILCFLAVRDEMMRLPDFLRHYRSLGVDRFVCVDNGSVDGTADFMADQPDVDLFATSSPFARARGGAFWLSGLARGRYADHWGVMADADELLVYDGCERHGLGDLVHVLEAGGQRSLPAMLLDMYPAGPLRAAIPSRDQRLTEICPLFDGRGYEPIGEDAAGTRTRIRKFRGGPRQRLFSCPGRTFYVELGKTPFARWSKDITLFDSHTVHPFDLNFVSPTGILLHFKLMSDLVERAETAVHRRSYFNDSKAYREALPLLQSLPDLSAVWEESRRYEGSASLVEAGLMSAIDWP